MCRMLDPFDWRHSSRDCVRSCFALFLNKKVMLDGSCYVKPSKTTSPCWIKSYCLFPDLQTDTIVMIAVQRGFVAEDHDDLLDAIETAVFGSVTGTLQLRDNSLDAYAMAFIEGEYFI